MRDSRIWPIARKEFIQMFRDRRTLIFILMTPLLQLLVIGYATGGQITNLPLAVVDHVSFSVAPGVSEAAPYGDLIHAMVDDEEAVRPQIHAALSGLGITVESIARTAPTLEDVFISLVLAQQATTQQAATRRGTMAAGSV